MNKLFALLLAAVVSAALFAQDVTTPAAQEPVAQTNAALEGADIMNIMPSGVTVRQPASVRSALRSQIQRNESRQFTGFRIRLYHESAQQAREMSETILDAVQRAYPGLGAERTYTNPYFNVTAGFFRTRTDAEKALKVLSQDWPDATIVKEKFKYPALDEPWRHRVDTIAVTTTVQDR